MLNFHSELTLFFQDFAKILGEEESVRVRDCGDRQGKEVKEGVGSKNDFLDLVTG